ncbi:MAG: N-acetyltransferase [Elusimicrobia bacterium]|nr:N-acetyltransferase [Elusimicrobiota bacterium]
MTTSRSIRKVGGGVKKFFVHKSSYVGEGVRIGEGTSVWYFCHIAKGAKIGKNCNIGQNVYIDKNVTIGDNVKIQNNVSVYLGVTIEDGAFLGPSCVFTNVKNPRSLYPKKTSEYSKTNVGKGATIGANATIVCGNTVGRHSFIGAGSVVTKNVPDYALVVGNPARHIGWLCRCGNKISFNKAVSRCKKCGLSYTKSKNTINIKK